MMEVLLQDYKLLLNDRTGSLVSFSNGEVEFICNGHTNRPLFTIRFRDPNGAAVDLSALQAEHFEVSADHGGADAGQHLTLLYKNVGGLPIHVTVNILSKTRDALSYWFLSVVTIHSPN